MDFQAYEKMPTSLKKLNLSEQQFTQLHKVNWAVTEKVHGANFSFVYENRLLGFAKRKARLDWNDDFFGFQLIAQQLEDNILSLFEALSLDFPAEKYTLYGELFGGAYPHTDVPAIPNLNAIQTGVYYSPDIRFCAFDIAIETVEHRYYLDYEKAVSYLEEAGIFHAKILHQGPLNTCLEFDIAFDSTIPSLLDLPSLEANLVEGVVLKPLQNVVPPSDGMYFRPTLKLKNEAFAEELKFHQAQKWSFTTDKKTNGETLNFLLLDLRNYVTKNRLNNVLSKIGQLDFENKKRLKEIKISYLEDVWQDFNLDHEQVLDLLDAKEQAWLQNRLSAEIKALLYK
jgi:Rnl2 family RNA ligase